MNENRENIQKESMQAEEQFSNSGNKKKLKVIFFIALVLLIALVVYVKLGIIDKKEKQEPVEKGKPEVKLEKSDYLNDLTNQDKEVLKEKEDVLLKKKEHCETMSGERKDNCLEIVKSLQVTILDKPELCEQLDSQKDQCLKNLAIHRKDQALCDLIEDSSLKRFCTDSLKYSQAMKENDIILCDDIVGKNQKDDCVERFIERENDLSFCDSEFIINNDLSNKCKSIILLNKSSHNDDPNICEEIPLEMYKDICLRRFSQE